MTKPIRFTVDDDPQVLRAVARDLRRRYGKDYSVLRADSGPAALEALAGLKERGDPTPTPRRRSRRSTRRASTSTC